MTQRLVGLLIALLIMVSSIADSEEKELKLGDSAPEFTLKDANDKEYSLEKLIGDDGTSERIAILVIGDRKVRKEAGKWAIELDRICQKNNKISPLMVADLRGKPLFITEGMVKRYIKEINPPIPIVLDRDGKVSKRYKAQQGKVNVFILDGGGRVCYRRTGLYSAEFIKEIQENVRTILITQFLHSNANFAQAIISYIH